MNSVPWGTAYTIHLLMGGAACLAMKIFLRPSLLIWLGQRPFCSPNWLSIWRIPIIWIGQLIFLIFGPDHLELQFIGFMLTATGLMLDHIDGKQAKHLATIALRRVGSPVLKLIKGDLVITPKAGISNGQSPLTPTNEIWAWYEQVKSPGPPPVIERSQVVMEEWIWRLMPGQTRLPMFNLVKDQRDQGAHRLVLTGMGEWIDPLVDKFNFLPVLVYFGAIGLIHPASVIVAVVIDLFGTIIRAPFNQLPIFRRLQVLVKETKASFIGKIKALFHSLTLLAVMPAAGRWLNADQLQKSFVISTVLLSVACMLGALSVLSRLTLREVILRSTGHRSSYVRLTKLFDHDIDEEKK